MNLIRVALAALLLTALLAPGSAWADTTVGTFDISGSLTLSSTSMAWGGTATIASGPTGILSTLGGASVGITDLDSATEPVGTPFTAQSFISFTSDPSLSALLTNFIFQGIDGSAGCTATPPAAGQLCTPSSPAGYLQALNFQNIPSPFGTAASVSWDLSGVSADGTEIWGAIFTSQFNTPFQTVLATIASDGSLTTSYSATFTILGNPISTAPEPSTIALLGVGLLGLIGAARRKRLA